MKKIAVFASGNGSNAEQIAHFFSENNDVEVSIILTNNLKAGVLERADRLNIHSLVFDRKSFYHTDNILNILKEKNIDLIVLAGFMWLVPHNILINYPNRIINIHPALLPKYGGKGMYGHHVHEAVIAAGETKSGISIHYVNEKYDEGQVIIQKELKVLENDTPETLASRIHELEYEYYPKAIEQVLTEL